MSDFPVIVDRAGLWDAEDLSDVAATTFPLACPPGLAAADIERFIDQALSTDRFGEYLSDPNRTVLKAVSGDEIVGYAMLVAGVPEAAAHAVVGRPAIELKKMYVVPGRHGSGVSTALMLAAVDTARRGEFAVVWLAVNQENERARRFYGKHGFDTVGVKPFRVGTRWCEDYIMRKEL